MPKKVDPITLDPAAVAAVIATCNIPVYDKRALASDLAAAFGLDDAFKLACVTLPAEYVRQL
jgi:hypothetical protein